MSCPQWNRTGTIRQGDLRRTVHGNGAGWFPRHAVNPVDSLAILETVAGHDLKGFPLGLFLRCFKEHEQAILNCLRRILALGKQLAAWSSAFVFASVQALIHLGRALDLFQWVHCRAREHDW